MIVLMEIAAYKRRPTRAIVLSSIMVIACIAALSLV